MKFLQISRKAAKKSLLIIHLSNPIILKKIFKVLRLLLESKKTRGNEFEIGKNLDKLEIFKSLLLEYD